MFGDRWIAHYGPYRFPPRSPGLTPSKYGRNFNLLITNLEGLVQLMTLNNWTNLSIFFLSLFITSNCMFNQYSDYILYCWCWYPYTVNCHAVLCINNSLPHTSRQMQILHDFWDTLYILQESIDVYQKVQCVYGRNLKI